ncbi:MAG TPA: hypothetical protein VII56_08250 [Rhizomicrobium sp.]
MKKTATLAALAILAASISPAAAAVCLPFTRIDSTKAISPTIILFRMKDRTVWRNTLRNACPGAMSGGITYDLQTDQVCENTQVIRVLDSGEACMLGAFTKDAPKG